MRTRDLERRHSQPPTLRLLIQRALAKRSSVQIIVGALAIAAIVLAFAARSAETPQGTKAGDAAGRPTVAPAAVVSLPTTVPSPTAKQEQTHVVASGDTLTGIAQKYYGDASKWNRIFEANRDVLPSSNSLQIGQKLRIPE